MMKYKKYDFTDTHPKSQKKKNKMESSLVEARILCTSQSPVEGGWFRRVMLNTGSGVVCGAIAGAALSAWRQAPGNLNKAGGRGGQFAFALQNLSQGALLFGTIGAAFAVGESSAEAFTGNHGPVAAGMGGAFAGAVMGMTTKTPRGVAGGAFLLGSMSFIMTAL